MKYYLFNPTGNITALIEDGNASEIMKMEPNCEQAGYIGKKAGADISLSMAGGEFCGNATMCAAYLTGKTDVKVHVEGTGIVNVRINGNTGEVEMPEVREITTLNGYPLVRFKGIDHVIIEDDLDSSLIEKWCIGEAMGFMYLNGNNLKPLVYVKSIQTLFYENSCASGTAAVGEYLKRKVSLNNPAGVLEYDKGILKGSVELIKKVEK